MKTDNLFDPSAVPPGLEARLDRLIDQLAVDERRMRKRRRYLAGMAAALAVLLTVGVLHHPEPRPEPPMALTPEEIHAYIEARKALVLMSRNFNWGLEKVERAMGEIEKTNAILDKIFIL
jgi:hypothetical protein